MQTLGNFVHGSAVNQLGNKIKTLPKRLDRVAVIPLYNKCGVALALKIVGQTLGAFKRGKGSHLHSV